MKKSLLFASCFGIIIKRDCTRYAMKREVAGLVTGNFRRVCPILNRATTNTDVTVRAVFLRDTKSAPVTMTQLGVSVLFPDKRRIIYERMFIRFFHEDTRNTRNSVQFLIVALKAHRNFKEAMLGGSQGKNQNQTQRI